MPIQTGPQLLPPPLLPSPKLSKYTNFPTTAATTTPTNNSNHHFRENLHYLTSLKLNLQKALTQNPRLLTTSLSTLKSTPHFLSSTIRLPPSAVTRILDMHPSLLTTNPNLHLRPILHFLLTQALIPSTDIPNSISRCPRLFVSSVTRQLRPALSFLQSLGLVIDSHTSLLLVYDVELSLKRKIEYLLKFGFEYEEVCEMVVRSPGILTYSVERNLSPKLEYFLRVMNGDLIELKWFPQFFSFSLQRKIIPRHLLLREFGVKIPLSKMLVVSDAEFNAKLIKMRLGKGG